MFDILKKKPTPEKTEVTKKPEAAEKPQAAKKPQKSQKKAKKPANPEPVEAKQVEAAVEDKAPKTRDVGKEIEDPFVCVKEYGSAEAISEKLDKEIAATKSSLGKYLRKLDKTRTLAEKSKKLHDVVAKLSNKKETKGNQNKIEVNGLEIILDATPLNELTAMESVVKSHQQRLRTLQKAQESLETLDQAGDTEGIHYLVLERDGGSHPACGREGTTKRLRGL